MTQQDGEGSMTDLEMTKLCAEAMGVPLMGSNVPFWDPLHDDAQAMALAKRFRIDVDAPLNDGGYWRTQLRDGRGNGGIQNMDKDLNRAIVECVAKMQGSKP